MAKLIRVFVVDDHPLFADGTVELLHQLPYIEPIGRALDLGEAVELIRERRPDVVLCDVLLGEQPLGLELPGLLRGIPEVRVPIIFLSQFGNRALIDRAMVAGASGYLLKSVELDELGLAIAAVAGGGKAFPSIANTSAPNQPRPPSPREAEIISLIADGASTGEVALRLGITVNTVESHMSRLLARYEVSSRTQLAVMADRYGWLLTDQRPPN